MNRVWIGIVAFVAGAWVWAGAVSEGSGLGSAPSTVAVNAPAISISRSEDGVKIAFTGVLQAAETIHGPWGDLLNASSPFAVDPAGSQKFFRARQAQPESIFSSRSVVELSVSGPLQIYFEKAFAGTPDGIFPPKREKPYFDGVVKIGGFEVPVSMRVRGNSSLQECPFPKLKFKVSKENRAGTPFFDAREIKIGTHCAEGGRGNIGRLREQKAAWREALAYEVMELFGFAGPRVRRAQIEYRDASPTNEFGSTGWVVVRNAMILDDADVVASRLGGRALDEEEITALEKANFDPQLITDLLLLHALFGNWDFALTVDGSELWNTDVIELPDGSLLPVAGDFDLSSWVTEIVHLDVPHYYHPELPDLPRQMLYTAEGIRARVGGDLFEAGIQRFENRRADLEAWIRAAEVDNAGRSNALAHVDAFFTAIRSVKR